MRRQHAALLFVTAIACGIPLSGAAEMRFIGTAKSFSGDTLYTETHEVSGSCREGSFQPDVHQVLYRWPDQDQPFAQKDLRYQESLIRPTVDFRQPQFRESIAVDYTGAFELEVNWQSPQGETLTFDVSFPENLVVDAGFDNFVRRHWGQITGGESVFFHVLAPTRGEHFAFVLEPAKSPDIEADHVFQIRPTGFVLRFLVDPIQLGYDTNGALTDYVGLTNIRKNKEENYTAHIRYSTTTWPDCELTP
ncbi:hypothetical protein LPB19_11470 [Marinobacter salinisoli]|uniref:Uncharacterized protein n=1 Tax=Marinobacter salinisoli TaxID=2769486 RepID=A0ABX7MQW2_9GAMM|nr:hypothetical protein [Marinobacter salinisoli]QSP93815.1 hypothetical protein LPB19_11470 [Marinobacter salinisoli]